MASPQLEDGYTKIADEIMEALCSFRIPGSVRQVIDCIIRKTYGWNKKEDWISHSQIVEMTGMKKGNVSRELTKAITHNIVIQSDNKLRLNKNYEEWTSFKTLSKVITGKKNQLLSKVIKPVIQSEVAVIQLEGNNKHYTKDTITKDITTNVVKEFGDPLINEVSKYFLDIMRIPKEDCPQGKSRRYWNLLLKESKTGVVGVKWLIDLAKQDEFLAPNITSSQDLYYKRIKIISRKRGSGKPVIAGWNGGAE